MSSYEHKRGDTFDRLVDIPTVDGDLGYADGYFVGWTPAAQIRRHQAPGPNTAPLGEAIATLTCAWVDPLTTRQLRITSSGPTPDWPLGPAEVDVQFTRDSDGYVLSTATAVIEIVRDVTIVPAPSPSP